MNRHFKLHIVFLLVVFTLSACSQSRIVSKSAGVVSTPVNKQTQNSFHQMGLASFYADKYQGRQTASGEIFKQNALTAAHKTLKFGTWVKVTNRNNGKHVIVRINDRGPFVKGRVIDLSTSAFSAIADKRIGIVEVGLEILR